MVSDSEGSSQSDNIAIFNSDETITNMSARYKSLIEHFD